MTHNLAQTIEKFTKDCRSIRNAMRWMFVLLAVTCGLAVVTAFA